MTTTSSIRNFLQNIPIEVILCVTSAAVIFRSAIQTDPMSVALGLAVLVMVGCFTACNSAILLAQKSRWNREKSFALTMGFGFVCTTFAMFTLIEPTHGQLLVQTANAICNSFSKAGGDTGAGVDAAKKAVDTVFWVLRGLLILYLAFAVMQVVQKRDDQEQMIQVARTPAMIAGATIILDVLALFVAGSGGACT